MSVPPKASSNPETLIRQVDVEMLIKMNRLRVWCLVVAGLAWSVGLWGCADRKVVQKSIVVPEDLQRILVVVFRDMNAGSEGQINVRCPLSGKVYVSGPVDPAASAFLTERLMAGLAAKEGREFQLITAEELWEIQSGLAEPEGAVPELRLVVEAGQALNADALLVGHIYRYIDRVGRNLSVESPASVAFDLHLVRVADGRVLWTGYFDETQKTLMEDMFDIGTFFEREGKWVTAEQMASVGLDKILESMKIP